MTTITISVTNQRDVSEQISKLDDDAKWTLFSSLVGSIQNTADASTGETRTTLRALAQDMRNLLHDDRTPQWLNAKG